MKFNPSDSVISTLEVIDIATHQRRVVLRERAHFEAPNWIPDNAALPAGLIVNAGGKLYRVAPDGGEVEPIDTGFAVRCNNDHGISPDGRWLAISHHVDERGGSSAIFVLPLEGGAPRRVTARTPSYWHGWSPDGQRLVYCAERDSDWDVYAIGVDGGDEARLTHTRELDDGPDYSPDGAHIFFNAFRGGKMQLWRMNSDGSAQTQLTHDSLSNWFPHPSPDGRWLAFISYLDDQADRHPPMKNVAIRLMSLADGSIETLASFVGGQGSLNVPSWSADSRRFAFVSYQPAT